MVRPRVRASSSARTLRSRGSGSGKNDLGAMPTHALNLDVRRRLGHDDDCRCLEGFGHQRNGLSVVARRIGDDASRSRLRRKLRDHVAGAANLESPAWLETFALQRQLGRRRLLRPASATDLQHWRSANQLANTARGQPDVVERHERRRLVDATFTHEASIVCRMLTLEIA